MSGATMEHSLLFPFTVGRKVTHAVVFKRFLFIKNDFYGSIWSKPIWKTYHSLCLPSQGSKTV